MIEFKNVTKVYKKDGKKVYLLKDVNFKILENKNIGILTQNPQERSMFLKVLGGFEYINSGEIITECSFSKPIGQIDGFQGPTTGRGMVKFVSRLHGKSEDEVTKILNYVQNFADVGEEFEKPLRETSTGVNPKIGFGINLAFDYDYLIIDNVIAIGDKNFKEKSKKALEDKMQNSHVVLATDTYSQLEKYCDAGIVLHNSQIFYYENITDAIQSYNNLSKTSLNTIYCSDGEVFLTMQEAANFYKVKPMSIIQAINKNSGSNIYLKKVFWKGAQKEQAFQNWYNMKDRETIISSDGVIFDNYEDASLFYMDRVPKANIDKMHIEEVMKNENGISKKLNLKFYYLSEYK